MDGRIIPLLFRLLEHRCGAKKKTNSSANKEPFYIENILKSSSGWLQLVFHIGNGNREEQLKIHPVKLLHDVEAEKLSQLLAADNNS